LLCFWVFFLSDASGQRDVWDLFVQALDTSHTHLVQAITDTDPNTGKKKKAHLYVRIIIITASPYKAREVIW
jgi:hypothetical protein